MKKEINIPYEQLTYEELSNQEKELYQKALEVRKNAYAPYSNYLVGCALLLENGEIITGSNQENAAYPSGLCAERTAIYWTSANRPHQRIMKLFIIGAPRDTENTPPTPPCGSCRQSISEYEFLQKTPIDVYFTSVGGAIIKVQSIKDLLPFSFDSSFL